MKKNGFLMLAMVLFPMLGMMAQTPEWLKGKWEGEGKQIDGMEWTFKVDAGETIKVDYPSLFCGGEWAVRKSEKKRVFLDEGLTYGTDKCDKGVEVMITKKGKKKIKVDFYLLSYSNEPIATGIISRVE